MDDRFLCSLSVQYAERQGRKGNQQNSLHDILQGQMFPQAIAAGYPNRISQPVSIWYNILRTSSTPTGLIPIKLVPEVFPWGFMLAWHGYASLT